MLATYEHSVSQLVSNFIAQGIQGIQGFRSQRSQRFRQLQSWLHCRLGCEASSGLPAVVGLHGAGGAPLVLISKWKAWKSVEIHGNPWKSVEIQWKSMEMPVLTSAALCAVEPTFIFRSCNMVLVMATR